MRIPIAGGAHSAQHRGKIREMTCIPDSARRMVTVGATAAVLVSVMACEAGNAHVTSPRGSAALERFVVIGGDLSMGVESGGVVSSTQGASWPAIIALEAGVTFQQPLFKSPGCSPPLVAPLILGRWLSGSSTATRDSSCAGAASSVIPPADNLALAGATAWAALNVTPKLMAAAPAAYDALDRVRYAFVLANPQSQVTAMLVKAPTFVAVELGSAEIVNAATSGLLVAAASYTQLAPWTYIPAAVAAPVITAISDSVLKSGAKAVMLSVPHVTRLPALRRGSEIGAQRTALAGYGVTVSGDCDANANLVNVVRKITPLALRALALGVAQPLSCANVPGTADQVLTPADVATLDAVADQINAQLKQIAQSHGWAFVDLDPAFSSMLTPVGSYVASAHLACAVPFGWYFSLDGLRPSPEGQHVVADAVAAAINGTYGLGLPVRGASTELRVNPCP